LYYFYKLKELKYKNNALNEQCYIMMGRRLKPIIRRQIATATMSRKKIDSLIRLFFLLMANEQYL